ncbi:MAG: 50S ribosomal protein L18 [bacterium]|nr:50S ribosomal protein L18 [bacterium]
MNNTARTIRVRNKLKLVSSRPRLSIFKSNRYLSVQLIDDQNNKSILGVHEKKMAGKTKIERIKQLAQQTAEQLKQAKQTKVYFDRGKNRYHGQIASFVEELRQAGINI